jgi:hypothetical protein
VRDKERERQIETERGRRERQRERKKQRWESQRGSARKESENGQRAHVLFWLCNSCYVTFFSLKLCTFGKDLDHWLRDCLRQ